MFGILHLAERALLKNASLTDPALFSGQACSSFINLGAFLRAFLVKSTAQQQKKYKYHKFKRKSTCYHIRKCDRIEFIFSCFSFIEDIGLNFKKIKFKRTTVFLHYLCLEC